MTDDIWKWTQVGEQRKKPGGIDRLSDTWGSNQTMNSHREKLKIVLITCFNETGGMRLGNKWLCLILPELCFETEGAMLRQKDVTSDANPSRRSPSRQRNENPLWKSSSPLLSFLAFSIFASASFPIFHEHTHSIDTKKHTLFQIWHNYG